MLKICMASRFNLKRNLSDQRLFLQDIILVEALKLDDVPAGLYSVHCLPLRLFGSDGSPIRCIIIKWWFPLWVFYHCCLFTMEVYDYHNYFFNQYFVAEIREWDKRYVSIVYGHQSCDTIQLNTLVVEMGFLCCDSKLWTVVVLYISFWLNKTDVIVCINLGPDDQAQFITKLS